MWKLNDVPTAWLGNVRFLWENKSLFRYFFSDLSAVRRLMSNDSTPLLSRNTKPALRRFGDNFCPSCRMPFDKAKKRRLVDTCGHERCYACMFRNETCPICIATGKCSIIEKHGLLIGLKLKTAMNEECCRTHDILFLEMQTKDRLI